MGKKPTPEELLHAIRANCMDCCGGSRREVHNCKITQCKLWPYRREEPKTCKDNEDGLCDRKGILVEDDDSCSKWQPSWKEHYITRFLKVK